MADLIPFLTNYDLGSLALDGTIIIEDSYLEKELYEYDVYKFEIYESAEIEISLDIASADDDADLVLLHDSNKNSV
ncbi:MAG: hypothetical protein AAF383_24750 [Cyanobacteria bacterium P01_A01_bin.83]